MQALRRTDLTIEAGQTVVIAMHAVTSAGGCEGGLKYEAVKPPDADASKSERPSVASVWLSWCNPPPNMTGKHGRFCETRTDGDSTGAGLALRVARDGPTQEFNNEVQFRISAAKAGVSPFSQ